MSACLAEGCPYLADGGSEWCPQHTELTWLCHFHDMHDEYDEPVGPQCGEPATHVIFWTNGGWSPACEPHVQENAIGELHDVILKVQSIL